MSEEDGSLRGYHIIYARVLKTSTLPDIHDRHSLSHAKRTRRGLTNHKLSGSLEVSATTTFGRVGPASSSISGSVASTVNYTVLCQSSQAARASSMSSLIRVRNSPWISGFGKEISFHPPAYNDYLQLSTSPSFKMLCRLLQMLPKLSGRSFRYPIFKDSHP
jgi:hypothetical protein